MANQKSMISNSQSKTILSVEDNPDDVELTLRAFEKTHHCEHGGGE